VFAARVVDARRREYPEEKSGQNVNSTQSGTFKPESRLSRRVNVYPPPSGTRK
jgi:hypothetical protein